MTTRAREAELALLIAEQEADDSDRVWQREVALDQTVGENGDTTLGEIIASVDSYGERTEVIRAPREQPELTDKQIAYIKYLNRKARWTQRKIAKHVGISNASVHRALKRSHHTATAGPIIELERRADIAVHMYRGGAHLRDVAAALYVECGYGSPESCYQQLRRLFHERSVPLRTSNWRHGRTSRTATRQTREHYWREQNERAARRRRAQMKRCAAYTREGHRCSRWARQGTGFCNVHAGLSGGPIRWTWEAILDALNGWRATHGAYPKPKDWSRAAVEHPNFKTVYGKFRSWPAALAAARSRDYYASRRRNAEAVSATRGSES